MIPRPLSFEIEPPQDLLPRVLARIARARRRAAWIRMTALGSLSVFSTLALVPAGLYIVEEFYASGFYDYLSLAFSDYSFTMAHWQELSLSLIESLPSIAILLLVSLVLMLLWSSRGVLRNARIAVRAVPTT